MTEDKQGGSPGKRKGGRPKGSKNRLAPVVAAPASECPAPGCGSTERGPYLDRTEQAYDGLIDGKPYTHIVRRRCRCLACGQLRIDRTYERRSKPKGRKKRRRKKARTPSK